MALAMPVLPPQSQINKAAQDMQWLRLLHYREGAKGQWRSIADDERFFLFQQGAEDAVLELSTALTHMSEPTKHENANNHAQCRFPARYHWLKVQFPQWAAQTQDQACPEYEDWIAQMRPKSATLIFPAAYINSPSSMFGHTLFRINSELQNDGSDVLAHSISYAADMPDDVSAWQYTYGGLFGGHPGYMYEASYYDKIIEYSDIDNRDIWEYPIKLSKDELDMMLRHVWELQTVRFDYYFLDENCALRLLDILDVAKPGLNSAKAFTTHAIPSDTVRALQETGILGTPVYRPARMTKLKHQLKQMDAQQKRIVKILSTDMALTREQVEQHLTQLQSQEPRARVLDLAYQYLRYKVDKGQINPTLARKRSLVMLSLRSKLPLFDELEPPAPLPSEQGHKTARVAVGVGELADEPFVSAKIRPAFHDVLDNDAGYVQGAQIDFLSVDARYYTDLEKARLQSFKLIDIKALSARDAFFKPFSWEFDIGWKRVDERLTHKNRFGVSVAGGVTQQLGDHARVSLMAKTGFDGGARFHGAWDAGVGAEASVLFNVPAHAPNLSSKLRLGASLWEYDDSNERDAMTFSAGLNIPVFNVNNAVRLQWKRKEQTALPDNPKQDFTELGWHHFF